MPELVVIYAGPYKITIEPTSEPVEGRVSGKIVAVDYDTHRQRVASAKRRGK
jgi:hypothetical protein